MSTSSTANPNVVVKATNGAAFRKIKVLAQHPSWLDFSSRISQLFDRLPPIVVYYYDEDDDLTIVDSQEEFDAMIEIAVNRGYKMRVGVGDPNAATDTILKNLSGGGSVSGVSLLNRTGSAASSVVDASIVRADPASAPTGNLIGDVSTGAPTVQSPAEGNSGDEGWERVDKASSSTATEYPAPPPIPEDSRPQPMQVTVESVPNSPVQEAKPAEELPKYSEVLPDNHRAAEHAPPSAPPERMMVDVGNVEAPAPSSAAAAALQEGESKSKKKETAEAAHEPANASSDNAQSGNNARSIQESIETLLNMVRGILQQHPELFEQATAVMNQIMDSFSNGANEWMQTFQEWQRHLSTAAANANNNSGEATGQNDNRGGNESGGGSFPNIFATPFVPPFARQDGDNDWRRGRFFGGGQHQGFRCGRGGPGRCGGGPPFGTWTPRMWGFGGSGNGPFGRRGGCGNRNSWGGQAAFRPFYTPFGNNPQGPGGMNSQRDAEQDNHPVTNQDHPGSFPTEAPPQAQNKPKPMDEKEVEEMANVVRNMGFKGRDEEVKSLIRRYGNLDRVVDILLREN